MPTAPRIWRSCCGRPPASLAPGGDPNEQGEWLGERGKKEDRSGAPEEGHCKFEELPVSVPAESVSLLERDEP